MANIEIQPEYSAQATNLKPNPFVRFGLEYIIINFLKYPKEKIKIVDLGCGKLRHLKILQELAHNVILVDTKNQIERIQKLGDIKGTLIDYINTIDQKDNVIEIIETTCFSERNVQADIILSAVVMSVVLPSSRISMAKAAYKNLKKDGFLLVIAPRNDSATLKNFRNDNILEDGHYFRNRGNGAYTFYVNYRNHQPLIKIFTDIGFTLVEDFSKFRQVCCIFQK